MVIQFDGPLGFSREVLTRTDVTAAVAEFEEKIGLR